MPQRLLNLLTIGFMSLLLFAGIWKWLGTEPQYEEVLAPNVKVPARTGVRYLYVHTDENFKSFKKYLYHQEMLEDTGSFCRLARQLGYAEAMRPGRYRL